ncbi:MAG: adenylate/guanylate cyclase domain-containing protein [Candidatus Rifleibacteriota bacterium]
MEFSIFSRIKSWSLIFFLSILPGLIFLWDWNPEGEENYRLEVEKQKWFNNSELCSESFARSTDMEYWQELLCKRFTSLATAHIEKGTSFETAFKRAWNNFRPDHFPEASILFYCLKKETVKSGRLGMPPDLSDYILKKLFNEIFKMLSGFESQLSNSVWAQRVKLLFGHMVFPDQFFPELRSFPFSVLVKGLPYSLVWNVIETPAGSKEMAGFLMFFDRNYGPDETPFELLMRHWSEVSAMKGVWPALIPVRQGLDKLLIHPKIDTPVFRSALQDFYRDKIKRVRSIVPELSDKISLPGELMGSPFVLGGKLVRICALSPTCGFLGLLVSDLPGPQQTLRQNIANFYFLVSGIVWLLFLLRTLIFRELPIIDLRLRIMAWFLAFAAFPAGLTIGAWSSLIEDFESYRVNQLQKGLTDSIQTVETGISQIDNHFSSVTRAYFSSRIFDQEIFALLKEPFREKETVSKIYDHFEKNEIKLAGAIILVQGGWCFSRLENGGLINDNNAQLMAAAALINRYFQGDDPNRYEQLKIPEAKEFLNWRVPTIMNVNDLDVRDNFSVMIECFDRVTDMRSEKRNYLQYIHRVNHNGGLLAVCMLIWDLTDQYKKVFRRNMARESLNFHNKWGIFPDMAVYHINRSQKRLLEKAGNIAGLDHIADFPVEKISHFYDGESASVMMPSVRFEDIRYAARVSAANVKLLVAQEQGFIVFSVTSLFLIIILGAASASIWISSPINRFVSCLRALNRGIPNKVAEEGRADELGMAAFSLQKMSEWILERERLIKFLPAQVLNLVAGGNVFKAGAGSMREVTVLVSDIRSFTTLSETYEPRLVFSMVNRHLQKMSQIIRENNGSVDRFVGDAVWAVFFAPGSESGHGALTASLQMMKAHEEIQQQRKNAGEFGYRIGIGVYSGRVLAGVFGDASVRLDFSVVGEALHEAERLEGLTRNFSRAGIVFSASLISVAKQMNLNFAHIEGEDACEVNSID